MMGKLANYFATKKKKETLRQCFKLAKIGRPVKGKQHDYMQYPKIHDVHIDEELEATRYVFTLPTGVDPSLLEKNIWIFKQMYGDNVELKGSYKKFILWVFDKSMPTK